MKDFMNIGSTILGNELGILIVLAIVFFIFGAIGFFPIFARDDEEKGSMWFGILVRRLNWGYVIFVTVVYYYLCALAGNSFTKLNTVVLPGYHWYLIFLIAFAIGLCLNIIYSRQIQPWLSNIKYKLRISQTGEQQSDIRVEMQKYKPAEFNPEKYFKKGHFFRGLNVNDKPIYETTETWQNHNQAAIGPTQTGKGVDIGCQLAQSILQNQCVIMIDPKPDKHARAIMKKYAEQAEREFVEIDLNGNYKSDKYAVFKNGSLREIRARMISVAGLEAGGTDSDFYKNQERMIIDDLIARREKQFRSLDGLLSELGRMETPPGTLYSVMRELATLDAIDDSGINIHDIISKNKVLYIRGNTLDNAILNATKLILTDIVQTLFATSKDLGGSRNHHVFVVVDEVRFVISSYLANALATMKATNAHMLIAYQAKSDIRNVSDSSVDKEALQNSVDVNTTSKLIYQSTDRETADWASEQTGTIIKKVMDRANVETNKFGGEVFSGETMMTQVEEAMFSPNVFLSFQAKVGARLMKGELPQVIKTHWINIDLDKHTPPMAEQETKKPVVFKKKKVVKDSIDDVIELKQKGSRKKDSEPLSLDFEEDQPPRDIDM